MPTTADLAWAAGIIEGEGHLAVQLERDGGTLKTALSVAQNTVDLLYRLRSVFACGRIAKSGEGGATWTVCGSDAEKVLTQCAKYFTTGGRKHREAIVWFDLRRTVGDGTAPTPRKIRKYRQVLAKQLKKIRHTVDNRINTL